MTTSIRALHHDMWLTELVLAEFDVRGAVIVGEQRALVWDTLSHPRDMEAVRGLVDEKPVDVVYSHADWDHCWGTAGLNAEMIIAHDSCGQRFRSGEVAEALAKKQEREPGEWDAVQIIPPTLTFTGFLSVDLGGVTVELHYLPGHTEDCLVAWIPKWGVLLAGDTVETPLPYLNDNSVELLPEWISGLEKWAADERVQTVVPAHGEVGDRSVIMRTLEYLKALQMGSPILLPDDLPPFYSESHARNQALMREIK
ncbi:MAG: MBL fold metallo-hydrolase [Anaerolineae bacterium]